MPDSVKILHSSIFDEISYISEPVVIKNNKILSCFYLNKTSESSEYPPPLSYYSDITPYFKIDILYEKNIDSLVSKINNLGYKINNEQISLLSLYLNENFRYFVIFRDTSEGYYSFYKTIIRIFFYDSIDTVPIRIISNSSKDFYFFTIGYHKTKIKNFELLYAEKFDLNELNFVNNCLHNLNVYLEKDMFLTSFKSGSVDLFLKIQKNSDDSEYQRIIYSFLYFFEPTIILILLFSFLLILNFHSE